MLSLARSCGSVFVASTLPDCILRAILEYVGRDVSRKRIDVGVRHCAFIDASGRPGFASSHFSRCHWHAGVMPQDAIAVATGREHTCVIRRNLDLVCFGANDHGQCDMPGAARKALAVAAGDYHTAVVTVRGDLLCFGRNHRGQCSLGGGVQDVIQVAANADRTAAVTIGGALHCFGCNFVGRVPPIGLGFVAEVALSPTHTCVLTTTGVVRCFGANQYGQCVVPPSLPMACGIAVGDRHTCVLTNTGRVMCFGDNSRFQSEVPVGIFLSSAKQVVAGAYHTCVLDSDRELRCFGNFEAVPPDIVDVAAVAANYGNTIVLTLDGTILCAGYCCEEYVQWSG